MKKKGLFGVFSVIFLSMILKIWWINNIPLSPLYDFETFYRVAVNLFNGEGFTLDGYPWAFQSYGYPLFLSLFFRLVNNSSIFTARYVMIYTVTGKAHLPRSNPWDYITEVNHVVNTIISSFFNQYSSSE